MVEGFFDGGGLKFHFQPSFFSNTLHKWEKVAASDNCTTGISFAFIQLVCSLSPGQPRRRVVGRHLPPEEQTYSPFNYLRSFVVLMTLVYDGGDSTGSVTAGYVTLHTGAVWQLCRMLRQIAALCAQRKIEIRKNLLFSFTYW